MFRKVETLIFYLLLFSISFQTRIILWQQNWYFNEWQAISLYGTDLLLLVLFYFWFKNYSGIKIRTHDYFLFLFLFFSALSIKNSHSFPLSIYQFVKLAEFVLFYFYLKNYALTKFNVFHGFLAIFTGGVLQAVIGISQLIRQSDLGFRILGETLLHPEMAGVAVFFNALGDKIMRPYGTAPHPNILATYLFVAIFAFYAWDLYNKQRTNKNQQILLFACYGLVLFGFLATFSRTIIFIFLLGMAIRLGLILAKKLLKKQKLKIKLGEILAVSLMVGTIFTFLYWPEIKSRVSISAEDEAVALRIYYNKESLGSGVNWTGVGIGNFVDWFMAKGPYHERWFYQPVHNIYLLIYAEIGLLGSISFLLFLILLIKDFILKTGLKTVPEYSILLMVLSFLFIGFFDHFLWTLQQGRLLFWLLLAMLNTDYTQKLADRT